MKKSVNYFLILIILGLSLYLISVYNGENTMANSNEIVSFIEVGEEYLMSGPFTDSTYGLNISTTKIEVLAIDNNWIKVRLVTDYSGKLFSGLEKAQSEWDYIWVNLNQVVGIVK